MSKKDELRILRTNTIININSKLQEKAMGKALLTVAKKLKEKFPSIKLDHATQWKLFDIIQDLKAAYPQVDFHCFFKTSAMRPDGGILSIVNHDGKAFPILIPEKKNQGTNDIRAQEGKRAQSKGNAIERLGKNVIGFRTAMKMESIFPFVCFGDGCDFAETSSILDRVVTIAQFGMLNIEHLHNQGANNEFDRGTFYFRVPEWTEEEMAALCLKIAEKSIFYYFSKYGEDQFISI